MYNYRYTIINTDAFRRTWVLTTEDVVEPPKRLAEECKKIGIEDGAFGVCEIGETIFF